MYLRRRFRYPWQNVYGKWALLSGGMKGFKNGTHRVIIILLVNIEICGIVSSVVFAMLDRYSQNHLNT
jgi:hypothetical protein